MESNEKGRKRALEKKLRKDAEKAKKQPSPEKAKAQVKTSGKPIKQTSADASPAKLPKPDFSGYTI